MAQLSEQAQTRLAVAALTAALVKTIGERDKSFSSLFMKELDRHYRNMEDYDTHPTGAMETLRWTKELIQSK